MTAEQDTKVLYGGAIKVNLPDTWLDARWVHNTCGVAATLTNLRRYSDLRQVPDNQEVYLSQQEDDLTLIVEVLQGVKDGAAKDDLEAAIR
jgi:hypothetical protein